MPRLRDALVAVVGLGPGGAPIVPWAPEDGSAEQFKVTADWIGCRRGSVELHAQKVAENASRAIVIMFGPRALIAEIAARSDRAWTLPELMADTGTLAMAVKRRWPVWRVAGTRMIPAVPSRPFFRYDVDGTLLASGESAAIPERTAPIRRYETDPNGVIRFPDAAMPLPVGWPGVALPVDLGPFHITSIVGPAWDRTISGYQDHRDAEDSRESKNTGR